MRFVTEEKHKQFIQSEWAGDHASGSAMRFLAMAYHVALK